MICFFVLRWSMTSSEKPRCALTSSRGVKASHCEREISWNWSVKLTWISYCVSQQAWIYYLLLEFPRASEANPRYFRCSVLMIWRSESVKPLRSELPTIGGWDIRNISRLFLNLQLVCRLGIGNVTYIEIESLRIARWSKERDPSSPLSENRHLIH